MDEDARAVYGNGPLFMCDIKGELPLFIPPSAKGTIGAHPAVTLCEMFHTSATKYPGKNAVNWRVPDTVAAGDAGTPSFYHHLATKAAGSHWEGMSWAALEAECYTFGAACLAAGMQSKDVCVVMGFNTPQWLLAFHGAVMAGGVVAGSYPTNNKETCEYLAQDCGAKIVMAESWAHGSKFERLLTDPADKLSLLVIWGDMGPVPPPLVASGKVVSFPDFMKTGAAQGAAGVARVQAEEAKLRPTMVCQLIYTSGTTGPPKGVMLSHDNLTWDVAAGLAGLKRDYGVTMGPEQVFLSYLPLSHIAAQVLDLMMACGSGGALYFATPDALSGGLLPLLQQTRPTFFFGVPRVWEKMMDAMKAKSAGSSDGQKKIALLAKQVGLLHNQGLAATGGKSAGDGCGGGLKYLLFKAIVYKKVKKTLGLDRCFLFGSGAAPIAKEVLEFFWSLDMPIIEGFGMSETTAIMTISAFPVNVRIGCVGGEVCQGGLMLDLERGQGFGPAGEEGHGEICLRGRNIMMGYLNKPEKTAETFDQSRYLRSGDLGKMFASPGHGPELLAITGRIKELIITAGGENVPPVLIEDAVKAACPMVSNAVLIGDKRKFLTCLLTLRVLMDPKTLQPTQQLDANCIMALQAIGSIATTLAAAKADPLVHKAIEEGLKKANSKAASRAQVVQKFVLLDTDFSVPGGELTGTQKLKRNVVSEKYSKEIEALYV